MKTKATQNAKPAHEADDADRPARSQPGVPGFISFLEMTSLLEEEDADSYQQVFDAIRVETDARSFLSLVDAKDYADKLFEERRYKSAIAQLMSAARSNSLLLTEDEQTLDTIGRFLPMVEKFVRMINSCQTGRRALLKSLRQISANRNNGGSRSIGTPD